MKFYHCFFTSLPDQFVEANADRLIKWVDGWDDKNRYLRRSMIVDEISVDVFGKVGRDEWPTLRSSSQIMLDRWIQKKGDSYNGRYWETLAEDQRRPDRKSRFAWGVDPASGQSATAITVAQQAASARDLVLLQQFMMSQQSALAAQVFGGGFASNNSLLRAAALLGKIQPKPPLKREGIVAGEIVGYRCWRVESGLLRSVYQTDVWYPGQVLEGRELGDWDSRGIHAWKDKGSKHYHDYIRGYLNKNTGLRLDFLNPEDIQRLKPTMVTGTVFLWGDVVEHERGWRAEFARVRSLDWLYPDASMMGSEEEALNKLRAKYGVLS